MGEFVVEKGVPIPGPRAVRKLYPWGELLEVGDSFLVPVADSGDVLLKNRCQASILGAWRRESRNRPFQVTTRQVDGGVRVWRIS